MLKHFIWDFDGTLFDTYPVLVDVFVELLEREGRTVEREQVAELMAISAKTPYEAFGVSRSVHSELQATKDDHRTRTV
nr:HAD hydrolase-like protein [Exiguobacterium sp. s143]